jgi:hypothetical protein
VLVLVLEANMDFTKSLNVVAQQATINVVMITHRRPVRRQQLSCTWMWQLALAALLLVPSPARAQEAEPVPLDRSFGIQLFEPAPGQDSLFTVESIRSAGHLNVEAGLVIGYQHRPFSIIPCEPDTEGNGSCELDRDNATHVVASHLEADVLASLTLFYMFQIAVAVPVVLYQAGDPFETYDGTSWVRHELDGSTGLGDIRLHLKWTAPFGIGARQDSGFGLAIAPVLSFPVGNAVVEDSFMGDGQVTVHPQVLLEYRVAHLQVAARVGYRWREESTFMSTEMGQQLTYALGASYAFPIGRRGHELRPVVEVFGANGFSTELDQSPLELDVGLHVRIAHDFLLMFGGGLGLIGAVGVPQARAFAGFFYSPQRFDRDRDGIEDRDDDCPREAEDVDGNEDTDGCPDPDNDGDGLPDGSDRCPDDPEDFDGNEDGDGCPELDNDGDGVNDGYDSCPDEDEDFDGYEDDDGCPDNDHDHDNIPTPRDHCPYEPEDTDGFADEDGCPDPDYDADGLNDEDDACPEEPEDFDGTEDDDGCPDLDNDGDGIPDLQDRCPDQPETWNATADDDGCPDGGRSFVTPTEDRLELAYPLEFAGDTDQVTGARTTGLLDIVATILRLRSTMRIRIVAYAADPALAQRRAEAVRRALVERGVAADRLEVRGSSPAPAGASPIDLQVIREDEAVGEPEASGDAGATQPPPPSGQD